MEAEACDFSLKGCQKVAGGRNGSVDHRKTDRRELHLGEVPEKPLHPPGVRQTTD